MFSAIGVIMMEMIRSSPFGVNSGDYGRHCLGFGVTEAASQIKHEPEGRTELFTKLLMFEAQRQNPSM